MQRVDKNARRGRRPRLKLQCVSRDYSFNVSEEFTRAAQLPMGRTEIKFGKTTTVARLPIKKLVYDHERCENSQFHQDFSLFWDDLANSS